MMFRRMRQLMRCQPCGHSVTAATNSPKFAVWCRPSMPQLTLSGTACYCDYLAKKPGFGRALLASVVWEIPSIANRDGQTQFVHTKSDIKYEARYIVTNQHMHNAVAAASTLSVVSLQTGAHGQTLAPLGKGTLLGQAGLPTWASPANGSHPAAGYMRETPRREGW